MGPTESKGVAPRASIISVSPNSSSSPVTCTLHKAGLAHLQSLKAWQGCRDFASALVWILLRCHWLRFCSLDERRTMKW